MGLLSLAVIFLFGCMTYKLYSGVEHFSAFDEPFPQDYLQSMNRSRTKQSLRKEAERDQYIGIYDNGGVMYDADFMKKERRLPAIREPAAYTRYIEDYIQRIPVPPKKPFPRY